MPGPGIKANWNGGGRFYARRHAKLLPFLNIRF